jgi:hypothetical protein
MLRGVTDNDDQDAAELEAAITWAAIEVADLTRLRWSGGGYRRPGDKGPYLRGIIGWPFMSWVLLSWLDAGLIEVCAGADWEPDEELRELGWLGRASPDRAWLKLDPVDARMLLSDTSLWDDGHDAGLMELVSSALGDQTSPDDWLRIAHESATLAPPLGEDPRQRALREEANANTDWERLAVKWEFPVGREAAENPGRIIAEPRLYIVRQRSEDGDLWARILADSEEQLHEIGGDLEWWLESIALTDDAIRFEVEVVRRSPPTPIDKGIPLRRVP